jgi:hypothetical protein
MAMYAVTVRAKIERASSDQISELLRAIPHALFDSTRHELIQTSFVRSKDERSAKGKAVRRVTWAMDDAGLRFSDYSITSSVASVPRDAEEG